MGTVVDRILRDIGDQELLGKLLALPRSDLNSLLLELYSGLAGKTAPADVLKAYQGNRFSTPSEAESSKFYSLEAELTGAAQRAGMKTVLLSPSAPFGCCSSFGCVSQNNIVSAVRGTETLSDPTNMLAIIIADKLRNDTESNRTPLHYAATARVVRAQAFSGKGFYSHFGVFCIVSSGKDSGSYACEKELLIKQLKYYKEMFLNKYDATISIALRKRGGYADGTGFFTRITDVIGTVLPDVPVSIETTQEENKYYKGVNFKIYMEKNGDKFELGDGGYVDWISQMTGSKKDRCLISGIGLDRLLLL